MSYRLSMSTPPGDGLRRCALEELTGARDTLAAAGPADRAEAVHTARKHVKKSRSLVRLARPELGNRRYRAINQALRDTGRTLSAARDADVLLAVVGDLREGAAGELPAAAFQDLEQAARANVAVGHGPAADPVPEALRRLDAVLEDIPRWPLDGMRWGGVLDGLDRTYQRGRADLRALGDDASADARHEWRKRVKDLWYQQRLIAPAWPAVLEAQAEEAHGLSELLGDDHDLAVLRAAIADGDLEAGPHADALLALVDARRDALLRDALALGRRVYAEPPKAHRRRLKRYLAAATAEGRATAAGV